MQHPDDFYRLLFTYLAAIAGAIPVFVMRDYWQSILALRWRAWLTERYVGAYLADRTFYRIAAEGVVDNPDQRINADIGAFTGTALVRRLLAEALRPGTKDAATPCS